MNWLLNWCERYIRWKMYRKYKGVLILWAVYRPEEMPLDSCFTQAAGKDESA